MRKYGFIAFTLLVLALVSTTTLGAAGENQNSKPEIQNARTDFSFKIDRALTEQFKQGKTTRGLIVFNAQADLSGAEKLATKQAKGAFVFNALRETAQRSQAKLRGQLDVQGIPYRAFYIANAIAVENLNAALASRFAAEANVARIVADPEVKLDAPTISDSPREAAATIEWGITKIGATKLWANGIRGKGIVVANQDTGVQWDHPALKNKYRGFNKKTQTVDHSYNWWDAIHSSITSGTNPCGLNLQAPCDDVNHGTHTMGTMVGRGGSNRIGVAPRAKWIACRNMDNGVGRPTTYLECFEFFLAPWDSNGNNPDPNRAPDVVSNSWGCPPSELCTPDSLLQATKALRAAGIFISMSAGNSGSSCDTINDPSAIYNASTTVGATDVQDHLAGFSSRGPVSVDASNRRKPDISAPGVNVRSSIPNNQYASFNGTSMAAPHLAGAVALLWNAKPNLRGKVGKTERLLFNSANPQVIPGPNPNQNCGGTTAGQIPNNLFGYGRLDVWKAYQIAK